MKSGIFYPFSGGFKWYRVRYPDGKVELYIRPEKEDVDELILHLDEVADEKGITILDLEVEEVAPGPLTIDLENTQRIIVDILRLPVRRRIKRREMARVLNEVVYGVQIPLWPQ